MKMCRLILILAMSSISFQVESAEHNLTSSSSENESIYKSIKSIVKDLSISGQAAPSLHQFIGNKNGVQWVTVSRYENKTKTSLINRLEDKLMGIMSTIQSEIMKGERVAKDLKSKMRMLAQELEKLGVKEILKNETFLSRVLQKAKELLNEMHSLLFSMSPAHKGSSVKRSENGGSSSFSKIWTAIESISYLSLKKEILEMDIDIPQFRKNVTDAGSKEYDLRLSNTNRLSLNRICTLVAFCRLRRASICSKLSRIPSRCRSRRSYEVASGGGYDSDNRDKESVAAWRTRVVTFLLSLSRPQIEKLQDNVVKMAVGQVTDLFSTVFSLGQDLFKGISEFLKQADNVSLFDVLSVVLST